jgi:hypothetical protein
MKFKLRITVYRSPLDGLCHAAHIFTDRISNVAVPGTVVLSEERTIEPKDIFAFQDDIRHQCRQQGIAHVQGLDP